MRHITIALALAAAALPAFAVETVTATVNGMVCSFCAQGIEKRLSKMDSAKEVFVDLKNRTVAVEAKEGKTLDQKTIASEIADAGYDVVKMESTPQSVAAIKAQMKGGK
jgi:copper chaperone CopZ